MDKIKQYYETDRISNSTLGRVENPKAFKKFKYDERDTPFFRIGKALDSQLTDPESWERDFVVLDYERPTGKMYDFVLALPEGLTKSSPIEDFSLAREESGYKYPLQWCVDNFWKTSDAVNFYNSRSLAKSGKILLSLSEYEGVMKAKESIMENDYISKFFYSQFVQHELMHQIPIYFQYQGLECKALLDGALIDHKEKTIQPFDLKTIGKSIYDFKDSFLRFGYYRQSAFYELAIKSKESPLFNYIKSGYKVLDFIFIVVESYKESINPAVIYVTSAKDRECGLNGGTVNNRKWKGINRLIEEYVFYKENDLWDIPKDLLETHGRIQLDVFN